jgi:predicted nucleotidyltransferase
MGIENTNILEDKLKKLLINYDKEVLAIYMFGSVLTPYFNEESDVDIAVLFKNIKTPLQTFNLKNHLNANIKKYTIDLIDLKSNLPIFLQYDIISKGKRFYTSEEISVLEFENIIFNLYVDYTISMKPLYENIISTNKILN